MMIESLVSYKTMLSIAEAEVAEHRNISSDIMMIKFLIIQVGYVQTVVSAV